MIPLPGLIQAFLDPWQMNVTETKEHLVHEHGPCTDLLPTFCVLRVGDRIAMTGVCALTEQRYEEATPGVPGTRWQNLCRQVVNLTKADIVLTAIEVTTSLPGEDHPIDTVEINLVTPEVVVTRLIPYTYGAQRDVLWRPLVEPDPNCLNRGADVEIDACRMAWSGTHVAYPASVRYLSGLCGTDWTGHPSLLAAIVNPN